MTDKLLTGTLLPKNKQTNKPNLIVTIMPGTFHSVSGVSDKVAKMDSAKLIPTVEKQQLISYVTVLDVTKTKRNLG